ncbi:MAG TPA: ATP-dependent DNA ligase [Candidatus Sulfotelmatobacter sp.]|nr:ATP-dependent DNA ligase [Candidatus Sulfotelmatobacter sp.]
MEYKLPARRQVIYSVDVQAFTTTCEAIGATTKKLQKTAIVADYLKSRSVDEAAVSAVFLSGRPFPAWEEARLQVGGRSLWAIVAALAGKGEAELTASYRRLGDLGAVARDVLPDRSVQGVTVLEVEAMFRQIAAARGAAARTALVRDLLARATPLEAKYIVKIMTGDLRIGLKESLVEEAIAKAYGSTVAEVQRANMLVGDIGETVRLAAAGRLDEARMRLFHPLGFMLASPAESTEEALSYFSEAAVEDKYDGIRAQAHVSDGEVRIFSRTRDEITESFPELPPVLAGLPQDCILDGEIVAWEYPLQPTDGIVEETVSEESEQKADNLGRARPFSVLQQRLGRKKVSDRMLQETRVAYLVFDVLYANGELMIERSLRERASILDALLGAPRESIQHRGHATTGLRAGREAQGNLGFEAEAEEAAGIIRAPVFRANSVEELEQLFVAARARGNEGLMIKDLQSTYTPRKRGKAWLKMKRELATLDVVVTAVEYGHGKRIGVLSDYTFAVWDGDRLLNIGKAYSGLTDAEIGEMTQWFLEHTIEDRGFLRIVEPKVVLEVAFNNMMRSERHESGYALRFPRIVRLRPDKSAEEADTLERAREIFARQV